MPLGDARHFDRLVDFLKQKRDEVTFHDIISLAEIATESLQSFCQAMDARVYRELREISGYIDSMRHEISVLQANDIKDSRIPAAGQELGAIVSATEKATHTIMECAETLTAADTKNPAAYKKLVDEQMMIIFEACSFQDITGQRVAKVVETLQHIESRVARFADVMHATDLEGYLTDQEREREARRMRVLSHGPQIDGQGIAQSEIDTLINAGR